MTLTSPRRNQRGQGTLEIVGIIVLASILVMATVGAVVQSSPTIRGEISYRICQIVTVATGGDCENPRADSPDDRIPDGPCVVGSTNASAKVTGAFTFVAGNAGRQYLVEEMSDGSFRVTEIESAGVGLTAAAPGARVSVTLDGVDYGAGEMASAEALLSGKMGNTWIVEDRDALDDLQSTLMKDKVVDAVVPDKFLGVVPNPINDLTKKVVGGDPPDPDETFVEGGLEGNAAAAISDITSGAGGDFHIGTYLGAKKTPDGYTAYYKNELEANAFGQYLAVEGQLYGKANTLVEVVLDKDGTPSSVRVTAGMSYGADIQHTLQGDEREYTEVTAEVPLTGDPVEDAKILASASSPLGIQSYMENAQENGTISRNTYDEDPNTYGFDVAGAFGGKVSFGASGDITVRDLKKAEYWDGNAMVDRPDCETD